MSIGPVDSETGSDHADSIAATASMFGASEPGRSRAAGTASTGDAASADRRARGRGGRRVLGRRRLQAFADVLDIINPLQHIPVVSTLYRSLTGDTIAPSISPDGGRAVRRADIGFASAMINSVYRGGHGRRRG